MQTASSVEHSFNEKGKYSCALSSYKCAQMPCFFCNFQDVISVVRESLRTYVRALRKAKCKKPGSRGCTTTCTYWCLPSRWDLNQSRTVPCVPIFVKSLLKKVLWSMVLKATERSSKQRISPLPASRWFRMSCWTRSRAVSVAQGEEFYSQTGTWSVSYGKLSVQISRTWQLSQLFWRQMTGWKDINNVS